jgi:hypothetical protein
MIRPKIIKLACHKMGTHSLQRLIEGLTDFTDQFEFFKLIQSHVLKLSFGTNSNHFILKIIKLFDIRIVDIIFNIEMNNFKELSVSARGLIVVNLLF